VKAFTNFNYGLFDMENHTLSLKFNRFTISTMTNDQHDGFVDLVSIYKQGLSYFNLHFNLLYV